MTTFSMTYKRCMDLHIGIELISDRVGLTKKAIRSTIVGDEEHLYSKVPCRQDNHDDLSRTMMRDILSEKNVRMYLLSEHHRPYW